MENQKIYIKCSGCKCLRGEDEYEIYKGTRRKSCLKCKEKREKNKDKVKEYKKQYREEHKEKVREAKKQFYEENKEKILQHQKQYREEHKDKNKEYQKQYRTDNKEHLAEQRKQYYENNKCEHNKGKGQCCICNPQLYLVNIQRMSLKRMLKISDLSKTKSTIEYLGCSPEYFKIYIQNKMTAEMKYENIHIDHIKPITRFNLDEPDEFLDCCHYTNLQPLLATDNMEKNNKWTDEDEIYWKENIRGIETTEIYLTK